MNTDVFEGRWRQMRGELKSWWGKLTDDDFEKIGGKKDRLLGMLQEKYGYTREAAQREIDRRFQEYERRGGASATGRSGQTMGGSPAAATTTAEQGGEARAAAEDIAASAASKASQSMSAVGEKIGSLAEVIREKAPHEGTVGSAATAVANKLGAAGSYLQEKKVDHMVGDLTSMIRRYPIPAILIGLGIGYLLAGRTRR